MPDILTAIADIIHHRTFVLPADAPGHTAINATGTTFERYFKDRLVGLEPGSDVERPIRYRQYLAYQGGANNPPDAMYQGGDSGDAFEFKKSQGSPGGDIPLNSSWPKDRLRCDSRMLTDECVKCEPWTERDLFYICGGVPKESTRISWIWVADARLMAADHTVYEGLREQIRLGISKIPGIRFAPTDELGKVNELDPTAATGLRIRGMWSLEKPGKFFSSVPGVRQSTSPTLHAILRKDKWNSMNKVSRNRIAKFVGTAGFSMNEVKVRDPNIVGATIDAILIRYEKDAT